MKLKKLMPLTLIALLCACGGEEAQDASLEIAVIPTPPIPVPTPVPTPSPTPSPSPTPAPTPGTAGYQTATFFPKFSSGLAVENHLNTKSVPPSSAPDVVGAFRFLCGPGQISYDDPVVYPGQPGKSHLHQWFGNLEADGNSTYESLRKSGESTCGSDLNRSAYWMPAMLDGNGNAVRPERISTYYKRRPKSDPWFKKTGNVPTVLPRGLRYVFGWDASRAGDAQKENRKHFQWKCIKGHSPIASGSMDEALAVCKPGMRLSVSINSAQCWDGTNLDSPDHRAHMSDMVSNKSTNYVKQCPTSHNHLVAQFTMSASWTIEPGDDTSKWGIASDHMLAAGEPRGSSMHADWLGAWEDSIMERWHANCIDKMLNCSDGDLGDGTIMKRNKHYPKDKAAPRVVAMPQRPNVS